ncbi:hypothetical protein BC938DRAFT_472603, partial [Jimgerdemannia flammicorona]
MWTGRANTPGGDVDADDDSGNVVFMNDGASLVSVMQQYSARPNTSEYDPAHCFILDLSPSSKIERVMNPEYWGEILADRPQAVEVEYHQEIDTLCNHLFGSKDKRPMQLEKARELWEKLRSVRSPLYSDDLSYNKGDWKKIIWWMEAAVGKFLSEFEPGRQSLAIYLERQWYNGYVLPLFADALKVDVSFKVEWGEIAVLSSLRRRNSEKDILREHAERARMADLLCSFNQYEIICGLACGGPSKYDISKYASDKFNLKRFLKDMLDDMIERYRGCGKDSSNLYVIGIQGLALNLLQELNSTPGISSSTPHRAPPNKMITVETPVKRQKIKSATKMILNP